MNISGPIVLATGTVTGGEWRFTRVSGDRGSSDTRKASNFACGRERWDSNPKEPIGWFEQF
jgi:hypothetical protein